MGVNVLGQLEGHRRAHLGAHPGEDAAERLSEGAIVLSGQEVGRQPLLAHLVPLCFLLQVEQSPTVSPQRTSSTKERSDAATGLDSSPLTLTVHDSLMLRWLLG